MVRLQVEHQEYADPMTGPDPDGIMQTEWRISADGLPFFTATASIVSPRRNFRTEVRRTSATSCRWCGLARNMDM